MTDTNNQNQVPALTTKETAGLRADYPSIEHLEAGNVAAWLVERQDQLLMRARTGRAEMNLSKLLTLGVTATGAVCYATSPLAPIGAILAGIGYVWAVGRDLNDSHQFAPIPFVRGDFFQFISAMGDSVARDEWFDQKNEMLDLVHHLDPFERHEFAMLRDFGSVVSQYLTTVESGKRFYAYRWLVDRFYDYQGTLPGQNDLVSHLNNVQIDPRINVGAVQALAQAAQLKNANVQAYQQALIMPPRTIEHEQKTLFMPSSSSETKLNAINVPSTPIEDKPTELIEFKSEVPDLPKLLAQSLKLTLIVGVPGSGKGIFVSNALSAVKQYHPNTTIFYIDPKNDPKETAYFSGRVDKLFRKDLMTCLPEDAAEWVTNCLAEYDAFDCGHNRKLLVFDELTLTLKTLGAVKVEKCVESPLTWLKRKLSGYSTSGDSRGIIFWGLSQNAHVSGLGMDGGDRTMFIPIFIIDARNVSASEGILKAQMIPSDKRLNSVEIQQLCKKSEIGRAIYFGGTNQWYPLPKLENYSGFDRDNRKFLPGFTPTPKSEKLVVDYDAVMNLENSFKLNGTEVKSPTEIESTDSQELSEAALLVLSFFDNAKIKSPKSIKELKDANKLRQLDSGMLLMTLRELVVKERLTFDEEGRYLKPDWQ